MDKKLLFLLVICAILVFSCIRNNPEAEEAIDTKNESFDKVPDEAPADQIQAETQIEEPRAAEVMENDHYILYDYGSPMEEVIMIQKRRLDTVTNEDLNVIFIKEKSSYGETAEALKKLDIGKIHIYPEDVKIGTVIKTETGFPMFVEYEQASR